VKGNLPVMLLKVQAVAQWLERSPRERGSWVPSATHHTKDVIIMVLDASLLSAQRVSIGLASLLSNLVQKREMDTIWNKQSIVINISWDNLSRNRP